MKPEKRSTSDVAIKEAGEAEPRLPSPDSCVLVINDDVVDDITQDEFASVINGPENSAYPGMSAILERFFEQSRNKSHKKLVEEMKLGPRLVETSTDT